MEGAKRGECHPLLKGRKRDGGGGYAHGLSDAQMKSLAAICEAFIPPFVSDELQCSGGREDPPSKALQAFFMASASDPPFPDEIAELMVKGGNKIGLILIKGVMLVLATRLGTLLLCGSQCLSWKKRFPSILKFCEMPLERREDVLKRWTREKYIVPIRLVFLMVKSFCFFVFFSWVDEHSRNPSWEAIGYSPPPKPLQPDAPPHRRPLDAGLIDANIETDVETLPSSLALKDLRVTDAADVLTLHCDAVVIGSGAGGAVAAAVLARSGHRVVVLEKGGYYVAADYSSLEGPSMGELYEGGGLLSTTDGGVMVLAGSAVGGGTAVNWSACLRTPEQVLREWAEERGLPLFRPGGEYEEAMGAVWGRLGITHACREEGLQNRILREGCHRLGLEAETVARNSGEGHYCGHCGYGCPTGEKRGTDTTWLVDAVESGAVILAGWKAEKLLLLACNPKSKEERQRKCLGVLARSVSGPRDTTRRLEIRAKVTISACGALRTPRLMLRSGLKNKHIGKNLHLHPVAMVWGHFPEAPADHSNFKGKTFEGGIVTSLHKVKPYETIIEAPMLGPATFSTITPWVSALDMKQRMVRYGRTAHLFALVRDRGSGTVDASGRITYSLHDRDRENIKEGARRALRILVAAGATEVGTHRSDGQRLRCGGGGGLLAKKVVEEFVGGVEAPRGPCVRGEEVWGTYGSAHQMGSCRMGASAEEGGVDGNGESWEAEGLFVCDGSLLPTAVGVNPMITIQSTAYCIAKRIVGLMERRKGMGIDN